ncbi:MAG: FmdB family zinc ribbon protein [Fidelibacterota bacterium]
MPNYKYKCKICAGEFTFFQPINDQPLRTCPECGGELVRLLTGGGGVIYKGAGFYVNDYKKSPKKPVEKKKDNSPKAS